MTLATGVGSLPGTDPAEAMRLVVDELPDFVHLPELPDRGPTASMTGTGAGGGGRARRSTCSRRAGGSPMPAQP